MTADYLAARLRATIAWCAFRAAAVALLVAARAWGDEVAHGHVARDTARALLAVRRPA